MGGVTAIVLAAGAGRRIGGEEPKAFLTLGDRPIVGLAAAAAAASPLITSVIVAAPAGLEDRAREAAAGLDVPLEVVTGGASRQASVATALEAVAPDVDAVACHDAARPFAAPDLFTSVVRALLGADADGAVPVIPVTDTMKRVVDGVVVGTEPREGLARAQTPQAFRLDALREAHLRAAQAGAGFTDDAAVLEWAGYRVIAVAGDPMNFKITTLLDLALARARMGSA